MNLTPLFSLSHLRQRGQLPVEGAEFLVVVNGVVQIVLSLAMCIVFGRAMVVARVAGQQDAANHRLWEAIDALRAAREASEPDASPENRNIPALRAEPGATADRPRD